MFNEVEETIIAILKDGESGLVGGNRQDWHVPASNITRQPPNLRSRNGLPAVSFRISEFSVDEANYAGIGELQESGDMLIESTTLKFDLSCCLDIWTLKQDRGNAIARKVIEILLTMRDRIGIERSDYRILSIRPVAGREMPVSQEGRPVFKRRLDYRIESELIIQIERRPIQDVIIERVRWRESHE